MPVVPRFLGGIFSGSRVMFRIDSPRMWSRFVTNALPPRGLSVCLSGVSSSVLCAPRIPSIAYQDEEEYASEGVLMG